MCLLQTLLKTCLLSHGWTHTHCTSLCSSQCVCTSLGRRRRGSRFMKRNYRQTKTKLTRAGRFSPRAWECTRCCVGTIISTALRCLNIGYLSPRASRLRDFDTCSCLFLYARWTKWNKHRLHTSNISQGSGDFRCFPEVLVNQIRVGDHFETLNCQFLLLIYESWDQIDASMCYYFIASYRFKEFIHVSDRIIPICSCISAVNDFKGV